MPTNLNIRCEISDTSSVRAVARNVCGPRADQGGWRTEIYSTEVEARDYGYYDQTHDGVGTA